MTLSPRAFPCTGFSPWLFLVTSPTPQENNELSQSSNDLKPIRKDGFLPATLDELKLVVWPSRQQLFSESIAVILMVTLSAASIAAIIRFQSLSILSTASRTSLVRRSFFLTPYNPA